MSDLTMVRDLIEDYARYAEHGDHDIGYLPECEVCAALAALTRLSARLERAQEALREIHEYQCGCDQPGRLDLCVAKPHSAFTALVPAGEEDGR